VNLRKTIITCWLIVLGGGIAAVFWYNEWKYQLPTPIPDSYTQVAAGTVIDDGILAGLDRDKPVFFHFSNPACPCSRFNIQHFRSLVKKYGDKIQFALVLVNNNLPSTTNEIQEKYDLHIRVLEDNGIAKACGVYSTPQAVILNTGGRLYFRGNYNKSRYCSDKKTNYAQKAIDSLLEHSPAPRLSPLAYRSYGCSLPQCKKQ